MAVKVNSRFDAREFLSNPQRRRDFEAELLLLEASLTIQQLLCEKGMTRSQLARDAGLSRGRVSQLLDGTANMTLRTYATLLHALRKRVKRVVIEDLPDEALAPSFPQLVSGVLQQAPARWQSKNNNSSSMSTDTCEAIVG